MIPIKTKVFGRGGPRIGLIAPKQPDNFWSLQGAVDLFGKKALMPNSALATIMALTSAEVNVEYLHFDENLAPIDWDVPLDLAAVTGTTVHAPRIREICMEYKARGIPVALGGPYASVNADLCRDLADFLFIGEAEYTWPRFLQEWPLGKARPEYRQADPVNIEESPSPDWSLLNHDAYLTMNVQTSRGCPHNCDFCDVVRYIGRQYRHKSVDQVMREVKNAHAQGNTNLFLSDDNFVGDRTFTRELLDRLLEWNSAQEHPVSFSTQCTINVADDEAMLRTMAAARFSVAFVGVETVREESLREVGKLHNLKNDNRDRLKKIGSYGIIPFVGMIVGFDNDDAEVFDDIFRFLEDTYCPVVSLSMLNAPRGTVLFERLQKEGRLVGDDMNGEWHAHTNVIPKQMSREELIRRHAELFRKIYDPDFFDGRLKNWLDHVSYYSPLYTKKKTDFRQMMGLARVLRYIVLEADPKVRRLFLRNIIWTIRNHPKLMRRTLAILAYFRHYYEFIKNHPPES